jgi:uroporphyrinogen-III synthase
VRVAAIGPATAAALDEHGVVVNRMPGEYRVEALLQELTRGGDPHFVRGQRFLLLRADIASPELAAGLRAAGAFVDDVPAYRTQLVTPGTDAMAELRRGIDVMTFTSSSTVHGFLSAVGTDDFGRPLVACIGPVTAESARRGGLHVGLVADRYTIPGLVAALEAHFAGMPSAEAQG